MAKPNYSFEKRQREMAKKKKKEEKLREKADRKVGGEGPSDADGPDGAPVSPAAGGATPPSS